MRLNSLAVLVLVAAVAAAVTASPMPDHGEAHDDTYVAEQHGGPHDADPYAAAAAGGDAYGAPPAYGGGGALHGGAAKKPCPKGKRPDYPDSGASNGNDYRPPMPDYPSGGASNGNDYRPPMPDYPEGGASHGGDYRPPTKKPCPKKKKGRRHNSGASNGSDYRPPMPDYPSGASNGNDYRPPMADYPEGGASNGNDYRPPMPDYSAPMPDYPEGGASHGGDYRPPTKKPCPKKGGRRHDSGASNGQYDAPIPDYPSGGASNGGYDAPYGGDGGASHGDDYRPTPSPKKPCPPKKGRGGHAGDNYDTPMYATPIRGQDPTMYANQGDSMDDY